MGGTGGEHDALCAHLHRLCTSKQTTRAVDDGGANSLRAPIFNHDLIDQHVGKDSCARGNSARKVRVVDTQLGTVRATEVTATTTVAPTRVPSERLDHEAELLRTLDEFLGREGAQRRRNLFDVDGPFDLLEVRFQLLSSEAFEPKSMGPIIQHMRWRTEANAAREHGRSANGSAHRHVDGRPATKPNRDGHTAVAPSLAKMLTRAHRLDLGGAQLWTFLEDDNVATRFSEQTGDHCSGCPRAYDDVIHVQVE